MVDLKTFEDSGHIFTYYLENGRVYLGTTTSEQQTLPKDTTGTIDIPPHIIYDNQVYDVYGTSVYSFYGVMITKLIFPHTLRSLAGTTCESMPNIEYIDLSRTKIPSIGDYTFQYCRKLKTLLLPETVTSIGASSLQECESLKSITISPFLTSFDNNFCTNNCLTTIIYCGSYYNDLILPSKINTIYVTKSYEGTTFYGKEIQRVSAECCFSLPTCQHQYALYIQIYYSLISIFFVFSA